MANKKINELVTRTPSLTDLILVGDPSSGYSYKCTVTALATIIETDIADGYVTIGTTQTISGAKTFSNNLTLTSVVNTPTDPDKFLTLNASNVVTYRTGSQVLSDIGAADDTLVVHLAGTETITGYKTFSSFAGFDSAISIKQNSTIVSQTGYGSIAASSTGFFLTRATGIHAFFNLNSLTTGRNFTFPDVTGTIALTSDITDALAGYVPTSRTLTINGVTQSLAANRTFNVGTVETVNFATGTTGTDVNVSGSPITTTGTITLNIPTASATNRGALSSTDWSTFNNKQSAISLTTTGNSGAATFVSNTLNIPNYTLSGLGGISGSGTTNYIPKFTSSSAIGNSQLFENGSKFTYDNSLGQIEFVNTTSSNTLSSYTTGAASYNDFITRAATHQWLIGGSEQMRLTSTGLGIGTSSPAYKLDVNGNAHIGTGDSRLIIGDVASANTESVIWLRTGSGKYAYSIAAQSLADESLTIARSTTQGGTTFSTASLTLNSSGNLGLGVTPSAWTTNYKAVQIGTAGISMLGGTSGINSFGQFGQNYYYDGINYRYLTSATANFINMSNGVIAFFNAPSGTAGNAITFTQAMTLDASGNLGLGTTSPTSYITRFLEVSNATSSGIKFTGGTSGLNLGVSLGYITSDKSFRITNYESTGVIRLETQDLTRATITAAGNFLIGTTTDAGYKLDVNGNLRVQSGTILSTGVNGNFLQSTRQSTNAQFQTWYDSDGTTRRGYFGYGAGGSNDFTLMNEVGILILGANNSERARFNSNGELLINTTSDAGDYKLQVNGNTLTSGSITTAAPSGGTAKPIKFGEIVTLGGSNTQGVRVEIDGTVYYLVTGYLP